MFMASFPITDRSLTSRRVLAALVSVEDSDRVGVMLGVPDARMEELKGKSASDYREGLVKHWLEMHPFASWEWLGGRLLQVEENAALQAVRGKVQAERGGCA